MTIFVNGSFLSREMCGVKRYAINVLTHISEGSEKIVVLAPTYIKNECFLGRGIEVRRIGKRYGTWWEQIELPAYMAALGTPPLLSLTNNCPILYRNNVVTLHDVIFLVHPGSFLFWKRPIFKFAAWTFVRRAKHVLTVSEFSKKEIVRNYHIQSDKITVAYNASPFDVVLEEGEGRKGYDPPYVLGFYSDCEYKNVDFLIHSFDRLIESGVVLKLVGGKQGRVGKVEFLGRVSDDALSALYMHAQAFVLPSLYEGFGLPPIEAQSLGCPVLASRIPALVEILRESAVFFEPTNPDDFIQKLTAVLDDNVLRRTVSAAGLLNAARFCWSNTANKILDVMTTIGRFEKSGHVHD